ncbi:heparinase II/III family protein [Massilia sp. erpn]|uniref:heparinase II/III domain-containing protein n=1 Tax=Massilia sp. erpn TaxID=2738142 RepID=UPI002107251F|nr:heparinase II/III family protein [Massilia sp. erpn]
MTLPLVLGTLLAGPATAGLPAAILQEHPHVLINTADIQRLKALVPSYLERPQDGGSISFTLTAKVKADGDMPAQPIFGRAQPFTIFLRHLNKYQSGQTSVQLGLGKPNGAYAFVTEFLVPLDKEVRITLRWDAKAEKFSYQLGGQDAVNLAWPKGEKWEPGIQYYEFGSWKDESIKDIELQDLGGKTLWTWNKADVAIQTAWQDYGSWLNSVVPKIAGCKLDSVITAENRFCNVKVGARNEITETMRQIALAYRLTGRPEYLEAAKAYARLLFKIGEEAAINGNDPRTVGGEWSMGARVAAMGYLYDWLFNEMGETVKDKSYSYRDKLVAEIKATVAADIAGSSGDLQNMVCGLAGFTNDALKFSCAGQLSYDKPGRNSIADTYLGGHNGSAIVATLTAMLAIAPEHPEVQELVEVIYNHFDKGLLPARAYVSLDGGYHMGYGYSATGADIAERMLLWRKALAEPVGGPVFAGEWQSKLIYPFIYGMRPDKTFPASGDNFAFSAMEVASLALHAAVNNDDPYAMAFYQQQLAGKRTFDKKRLLWEKLLYPVTTTGSDLSSLPLGQHFRRAGQVLVRDTWDYDKATLLEFKSTSFSSLNHQHLDQNSFALSYKAPLLLDSGGLDKYESSHWKNYYTRTIAHNSIVVFDEKEQFAKDGVVYSNDGGQWFHNKVFSPTLPDILPGARNSLDGVTSFEHGADYTYMLGNASKAYNAEKMDQNHGFLRHIVYLQPDQGESKPTVIVFDAVRTKGLKATSLLHFAQKPEADATVSEGVEAAGRRQLQFAENSQRNLTIRNGGGLVTVQTLLPQNAVFHSVGGTSGSCRQKEGDTPVEPGSDCRFLVRALDESGRYQWTNFRFGPFGSDKADPQDYGAWRLETMPLEYAPVQHFLVVLNVGDNAAGASGPAAVAPATRLPAQGAEAVQIGRRLVIFNREPTPATSYGWTAACNLSTLVTGLKPGSRYALSMAKNGDQYVHTLLETASGGHVSSDNGVLKLGPSAQSACGNGGSGS